MGIWPTTSPQLLSYVLLLSLQEKKNKNLILELFIFTFDFSCNKRVSQSLFFSASNWIIVTKLMASTDYFPSCQLYHYTNWIIVTKLMESTDYFPSCQLYHYTKIFKLRTMNMHALRDLI